MQSVPLQFNFFTQRKHPIEGLRTHPHGDVLLAAEGLRVEFLRLRQLSLNELGLLGFYAGQVYTVVAVGLLAFQLLR